jgi:hypothetical protein
VVDEYSGSSEVVQGNLNSNVFHGSSLVKHEDASVCVMDCGKIQFIQHECTNHGTQNSISRYTIEVLADGLWSPNTEQA